MAVIKEPMAKPLIPNTIMNKMMVNGVHNGYEIQAIDGYVLHDNRVDTEEFDPESLEPTGNIIPGFKVGSTTVSENYDFPNVLNGTYNDTDENGKTITVSVEKVGVYELYTLPRKAVVSDEIKVV